MSAGDYTMSQAEKEALAAVEAAIRALREARAKCAAAELSRMNVLMPLGSLAEEARHVALVIEGRV